ncbi:MAG: hypothetical protein HKN37_06765 [Rhodothermales bacterium]|nr:hypothetical protein [Rhodothermales bacterium]
MPHKIEISDDPGIARVCVDGSVDLGYWRWVLFDALQRGQKQQVSLFLLDLRTADLIVDPSELQDMGETVRRLLAPDVRVAGVISPSDRGPANDHHDLNDTRFVHLFASEGDALRWLSSDSREAAA